MAQSMIGLVKFSVSEQRFKLWIIPLFTPKAPKITNGQSAAVASMAQWQSCEMCEYMRSGLTWRPALGKSLQMNWKLQCLICCAVNVVAPVLIELWLSLVHVNPRCCSSSVIE